MGYTVYRTNCIYCEESGKCNHNAKRKKILGLISYKPTCKTSDCQYRIERFLRPMSPPKTVSKSVDNGSHSYSSDNKPTCRSSYTDSIVAHSVNDSTFSSLTSDSYSGGSSGGGGSSRSWDSSDYSSSDNGSGFDSGCSGCD